MQGNTKSSTKSESVEDLDQVSQHAAFLAVIEIGLGSIVHGFKIPFGGQALSVNQGMVLTHAAKSVRSKVLSSMLIISTIVAVLKSLSPAGNKLGPMLSICMQGFLYTIGLSVFGINVLGVAVGMALLSLWAFIQPFVTLYIFFGHGLIEAIEFYIVKMTRSLGLSADHFFYGLLVIISVKVVIAVFAGVMTFRRTKSEQFSLKRLPSVSNSFFAGLSKERKSSLKEVFKLSLKDLTRPFFLISFVLMVVFFSFSQSDWSQTIWLSLRPLAIAFVFFFLCRAPWLYRIGRFLRRYRGFKSFFMVMDSTVEKIIEWQYSEKETPVSQIGSKGVL